MADAMQGLRELADVLNIETARISGDPQRLQLALGESQSRKLQEVNNLIDAEIDKLDMPESQKRLLKALSPQEKYQAIYGEEKKKTVADYKAYLAEKKLKGIPFTPQDKELENYLTKTDPIDQLTDVIVQQQLAVLGIGGGVYYVFTDDTPVEDEYQDEYYDETAGENYDDYEQISQDTADYYIE